MIEYYSVRDKDGDEVKAFDTLEEANDYCDNHDDYDYSIVKVVM